MELVGTTGYQFTANLNKEFKLFLTFSNRDGTYYKYSSTSGVVGEIYGDMTANVLSFGPSVGGIKLIGNNDDSNMYDIWIRLAPKGGIINFKTDTPEHTTFYWLSSGPPLTGNPSIQIDKYETTKSPIQKTYYLPK